MAFIVTMDSPPTNLTMRVGIRIKLNFDSAVYGVFQVSSRAPVVRCVISNSKRLWLESAFRDYNIGKFGTALLYGSQKIGVETNLKDGRRLSFRGQAWYQ